MLKRIIVCAGLILAAAVSARGADGAFPMPASMRKLLPEDPAFILAIASVNDLDRQWRAIETMLDDSDSTGTDLMAQLVARMPRFAEYADLDRPLALTMVLPDLMAGEEPAVTFIVPLRERSPSEGPPVLDREGLVSVTEGDYLALSADARYAPAAEVPALAGHLSPGVLTGSLDLERVMAAYGPMIRMGLAAAQEGTAPSRAPAPSAEELAALEELVQAFLTSARRLDMAVMVDGPSLTFHSGFAVLPGSSLDPGGQPSFEDALQLTRMLPPGGNIVQAIALDQTRQFGLFRNFYTAGMERDIAHLPEEQAAAYRAWFTSYLESVDLFANPIAASLRTTPTGMAVNLVMQCADAPRDLERMAALFDGLTAADIGIRLKKLPTGKVAGGAVHSWTITYDADRMAGFAGGPPDPALGGTGRLQAEQMVAFLRKVTPNINLTARGNRLILSADADPANLTHMIQLAGQRRGAAHPRLAAVAAKAGPACQQAVAGDLMALFGWITTWLEEIEQEEFEALEGNPIPFTASVTVDGADYGLDGTMDMPAVQQFIKAVQQLEAMRP